MFRPRFALLALGLLALGGCRFKSWESFSSATYAGPMQPTWGGNAYQSAGLADETGGRKTDVQYGRGARNDQTAGFDERTDQPAKGSSQHPGDLPNVARPGYGQQNGPALEPGASDVGQPGIESGRGY